MLHISSAPLLPNIVTFGQHLANLFAKVEIRSVEQGICPIATLYSLAAALQRLTLL